MTVPEFSRPIALDTIGDGGRTVTIEADAGERAALAERFGYLAIDRLTTTAAVRRTATGVEADGTLSAALTQACVVSGEPVAETVEEPFTLTFADVGAPAQEEIELGDADLDVLPIENGAIDLGEAAAQTLGLGANPFPRSPAADAVIGKVAETRPNPFSVLGSMLGKGP